VSVSGPIFEELGVIDVPRAEVLRLLGGRGREPRSSVALMVDEELARAAELAAPRAALRLAPDGLASTSTPGPAFCQTPLVAAVCTVGPALEARVAVLIERGERARALVADAAASAAAEAAADRAERLACRLAGGCVAAGRRVSPGYGTWPLEEQRLLVAFVGAAAIGVTLTPQLMMVPRKSVSFVVPIGPGVQGDAGPGPCAGCELVSCPYRGERSEP
jgi:hypothetical protein